MDQLFEILIPVIIAAVYFFSNVLNKKNSEEEGPRAPGSYDDGEDYDERQRRIQEEIRRKIMERRQQQEEASSTSPPPIQREVPSQQLTPADHRLRERLRETQERMRHKVEADEPPVVVPPPMPVAEVPAKEPQGFSWDTSDNIYEQQLEAQLQQIEATKRHAEALRAKAEGASAKVARRRRSSGASLLQGPVREQLKNPSAARAAIIYREVLGKPKALQ
ncbi:hypothetical protein [Coraliomargarita akajimensis]|uniref:Uncharacterized protein n=1 Tax=Coraliomargarita akajimensis (strain DSM 45221 / IAM 15411 / JCM 23193 / KCTC 12865 / 04OKA010-24) TaxID=583355 RepID=D5ELL3_CORAD|nr:hypothetical protein [Coraliomargarita akajimensis]ADE55149.1 hypothetical protein Caka_2131 [Coraliomargarita akajimensis DSM 45221]